MRAIQVSTDVFSRIWAVRQPGEETEDAILRRVLSFDPGGGVPIMPPSPVGGADPETGYYDERHRVSFPTGFEIFRTYLGREYRAVAGGGCWTLVGDGRSFRSLNELSRAIGAKTENAWQNWLYRSHEGARRTVSDMRDPKIISARGGVSDASEGAKRHESEAQLDAGKGPQRPDLSGVGEDATWRDDVRLALEQLHSRAPLREIYQEVESIRRAAGRSIPRTLEATVRRTLEDHSSDSKNYRGGLDLFCMPEGKGSGIWALRSKQR